MMDSDNKVLLCQEASVGYICRGLTRKYCNHDT